MAEVMRGTESSRDWKREGGARPYDGRRPGWGGASAETRGWAGRARCVTSALLALTSAPVSAIGAKWTMRGDGVSDAGRRTGPWSWEMARRRALGYETLTLMLWALRWVRAPAWVLRGWPESPFKAIVALDAVGPGAGLRPATASANDLFGRVADGERTEPGAGLVAIAIDSAMGLGGTIIWITSSSCSSMIVERDAGGAWSLNDASRGIRRGRIAAGAGGGSARNDIGAVSVMGEGSEQGVVGVVGLRNVSIQQK